MNFTALRILLVDDDDSIREVVAEYLRRHHFQVTDVSGVVAARHEMVLARGAFDVVVTDVRLPDGCGLVFAQEVVDMPEPRPRVILMTGHLDDEAMPALLTTGCVEILLKPFGLRALLQHVRGASAPSQVAPSELCA